MAFASLSKSLRSRLVANKSFRRLFALVTFATLAFSTSLALLVPTVFAQSQTLTTTTGSLENGTGLLAAGLAITGSCIAAGYAVGKAALP